MSTSVVQTASRRPGLVSCRLAEDGRYLVRDRGTGDSFQLGEEEHFLLERLDGRTALEDICAAFAVRFNDPLSAEDLEQFLVLAAERGLLQAPSTQADGAAVVGPLEQLQGAPLGSAARPAFWKRTTIPLLNASATALNWSTWLPQRIAGWAQQRVRHLQYTPRADDVFIVTYPRSGTTWMQMILYQLTTAGDVDFPHIAEFCPWFEKSVRSAHGFELRPSPRLFKSHLHYRWIPKGAGKYIYVARDGKDVAVSYDHLYRRYNGYEGTFDEFFERFLKGRVGFGSWFQHVRGWWERRNDPNVLFLTYEDLKSNFDATVQRIAGFCGWDLLPEKLERVRLRSSFEFMKQHESRFDPALETLWEEGVQLKAFLRNGRVGEGAVTLNAEQAARFDAAYADRLARLGVRLP
jgi:Sulfotransferase domain